MQRGEGRGGERRGEDVALRRGDFLPTSRDVKNDAVTLISCARYRIRVALMSPYRREVVHLSHLSTYLYSAVLSLPTRAGRISRDCYQHTPLQPSHSLFHLHPRQPSWPDLTLRGTTCHADPDDISVVVVVVVVVAGRRGLCNSPFLFPRVSW